MWNGHPTRPSWMISLIFFCPCLPSTALLTHHLSWLLGVSDHAEDETMDVRQGWLIAANLQTLLFLVIAQMAYFARRHTVGIVVTEHEC